MIQIQLKAKHFYYIISYLKNASISQYYSLITRIKTLLSNNTDDDALFILSVIPDEVNSIFRLLTSLPEGQATMINAEMMDMLQAQMIAGITNEMMNGIVPNADDSLPENAYWQKLSRMIIFIRDENFNTRDAAILVGKNFINEI